MLNQLKYIDVIVPLSVNGIYQYSVDIDQNIKVGQRVIVQFGIKKQYTALVVSISNKKNNDFKIKKIISVLDNQPIVNQKQIKFWKWMSKYYMANIGDVLNTALPNSLKLASESRIILNNSYTIKLNDKEQEIVEVLKDKTSISLKQLKDILFFKNYFSVVNGLIKKDVIRVYEFLKNKYSEKLISKVEINEISKNLFSSLKGKQ